MPALRLKSARRGQRLQVPEWCRSWRPHQFGLLPVYCLVQKAVLKDLPCLPQTMKETPAETFRPARLAAQSPRERVEWVWQTQLNWMPQRAAQPIGRVAGDWGMSRPDRDWQGPGYFRQAAQVRQRTLPVTQAVPSPELRRVARPLAERLLPAADLPRDLLRSGPMRHLEAG
ncbi:hypothetical protein LAB1_22840 [Roseibium sp. LAB1]